MHQNSMTYAFVWSDARSRPSNATIPLWIAHYETVRGDNSRSKGPRRRASTIYSFLKDLVLSHEGHIQRDEDVLYCKFLKSDQGLRRMKYACEMSRQSRQTTSTPVL